MIKIENLNFKYNKYSRSVIDNLSFEVHNGINVLLGLNGCGKTTLIKLLAGLEKPTDGNIYYDNENLSSIKILERSKIFAYVSQRAIGNNEFTIRDYLAYGFVNSLSFYESPKKNQLNKIEKIANRFNISHLLDKNLGEVSGGERQIVCIAGAILQNTPIILLDEPTSALDLKNQDLVLSVLKEIAKEENKIIILSSHNPNHALYLDSNVLLMNNGKIINSGNSKDMIKVDILKEVYGDKICLSKDLDYEEISFKE